MKLYRNFESQESIDLEYNLALSVPDIGNWLNWYAQESLLTRHNRDCVLDVHYGPTVDETIDIFPAKQQGAPLLLFIHGGYWVRCSSKDFSFVANGLADQGITVAILNYSLCPKVTIPEITRQSRAAIAWLHKEASRFNADSSRIFVTGHSAGGQQVGMLSATSWTKDYDLPDDIIKGGISVSGIFDLHPLRYSYLQPKLLLSHETILRQSPYFNIPCTGPSLLLTLGEKETTEFHRQSKEFLHAWQAKGLQGELLVQKAKHHFSAIEDLNDSSSKLCKKFSDFIVQCENSPRPTSRKPSI